MSGIDDVLPLPKQAEVRLLCPDVLVVRNIVLWGDELIRVSENIGQWRQSGQVRPGPTASKNYTSAYRTSRSLVVTHQDPDYGPCLKRFEHGLMRAFHTAALAYKCYNPDLVMTDDSGYEVLRYRKGEQFDVHIDTIVGRTEGYRQLSAVCYLNNNYSGGETFFPRQQIKFRPEPGDILLFPSNFCYPHASLPVTTGTKYSVVTWFVAFPEKTQATEQEDGDANEEAVGIGADAGASPDDERVRMVRDTPGSSTAEGEPTASGGVHSACAGGRARQGEGSRW